jgi:hypothetical protein
MIMSDKPIHKLLKIHGKGTGGQAFALSFMCGFCCALFTMSSSAADSGNTITIDVNNPNSGVDYNQVDKFMNAEAPTHKINFAVKDGNEIILSEHKIVQNSQGKRIMAQKITTTPTAEDNIILVEETPYAPTRLADLGYGVYPANAFRENNAVKMRPHQLASRQLRTVPNVPEMYIPPVQTTLAAAAPVANRAATPASSSRLITLDELVGMVTYFWLTTLTITLTLLAALLIMRSRRTAKPEYALRYAGEVGAPNEMVGKGAYFDFTGQVMKGEVMTINTNYLNMLWQVGKFSEYGAVNTYFYMAFYIPPQEYYAAQLKRNGQTTQQEEKIH